MSLSDKIRKFLGIYDTRLSVVLRKFPDNVRVYDLRDQGRHRRGTVVEPWHYERSGMFVRVHWDDYTDNTRREQVNPKYIEVLK